MFILKLPFKLVFWVIALPFIILKILFIGKTKNDLKKVYIKFHEIVLFLAFLEGYTSNEDNDKKSVKIRNEYEKILSGRNKLPKMSKKTLKNHYDNIITINKNCKKLYDKQIKGLLYTKKFEELFKPKPHFMRDINHLD